MLRDAAAALDLDLSRSWMIGDSDVDIQAGREAGCRTILVENPRSAHRRRDDGPVDFRVSTVAQAADIVAAEAR